MATLPGAFTLIATTPHGRSELAWTLHEAHFGREGDVLVWNADTLSMNAGIDRSLIDAAFEADPAVALAEWGRDGRVAPRQDVEALFTPWALDAVTVAGRVELVPRAGIAGIRGFVDAASGSRGGG